MRWETICALTLLVVTSIARARTIDTTPRPAALLKSEHFVAQDSPSSVTLYTRTGSAVHRYVATGNVTSFAVTPDDRYVLAAYADGQLVLGDLQTGGTVWVKPPAESGLQYAVDASFAGNGRSFVVCDQRDQALVFETLTGKRVGAVRFNPMETNVMSASLSPDGATGALVELGGRVFTFDVASGTMRDTGQTGAWPIRFSEDGRHVVFRSNNSGVSEHLRVVDVDDTTVKRDVGQFGNIGYIRPVADGTVRVTAVESRNPSGAGGGGSVGVECDVATGIVRPVWHGGSGSVARRRTDFDAVKLIGVSTDHRLVTSVIDLRTGTTVLTIDNSATYRPTLVSWSSRGRGFAAVVVAGVAVLGGIITVVLLARRRRSA